MSKNLSAKYYQDNKERLQKKFVKDIKIIPKKKKKKKVKYNCERYKNLSEEENKSMLSMEKKL